MNEIIVAKLIKVRVHGTAWVTLSLMNPPSRTQSHQFRKSMALGKEPYSVHNAGKRGTRKVSDPARNTVVMNDAARRVSWDMGVGWSWAGHFLMTDRCEPSLLPTDKCTHGHTRQCPLTRVGTVRFPASGVPIDLFAGWLQADDAQVPMGPKSVRTVVRGRATWPSSPVGRVRRVDVPIFDELNLRHIT